MEKYDKKTSLSSHFHPFPVIVFVSEMEGECTYRIDGKTYKTETSDLILCNPGVYHEKFLKEGSSISEFHIAFDHFVLTGLPADTLLGGSSHAVIHAPHKHDKYMASFQEALDEQENKKTGYEIVLKAILIKFVIEMFRDFFNPETAVLQPSQNHVRISKMEIVDHLKIFLYQNYNSDIYFKTVARNMYVSPTYLCKIFKEITGDTPVGFLIKIRLNKARELLELNILSLKEISKSIGYNDYYHFSKLFKKHFGISPLKYKSENKIS